MARLDGRVALVTGGASGIGAACARRLASDGARVVITDIQDSRGQDLAREIGAGAIYRRHDVTEEAAWEELIGELRRDLKRLDVLVNNAGIGLGAATITEMSLADFRRQQSVNVEGVFLGCKHGLKLMREAGKGGSIVNISSVAGLRGSPFLAAYCATKGAVRLFSKAVAMECAHAKDGVRVNSVHPGIIETPIWLTVIPGGEARANAPPDLDAISVQAVPMGIKGLPSDIADAVAWLASDESRYVTGAEIVVDGGMTAR